MTEFEQQVPEEGYSRRQRNGGRRYKTHHHTVEWDKDFLKGVPSISIFPSFLWSLVIGCLSVANPLLISFANNLQTQFLYAGLAMQAGQSPYNDFFGTNGVLYYLMVYLGYLLAFPALIAVLQTIALWIAGIYFNKIAVYYTKSRTLATHLTVWFYLFILAIGFGGLYASLFALPFVLTSIWFLIRYFGNAVRDESFILYGIDAALVFLIYPKSLLLWIVAAIILFIYNLQHRRIARGFYQLLAALFGFLLITYTVGYYAFEQQILGTAIKQTFLYNIRLDFTYTSIWQTLAILGAILICSGFLKNLIQTLLSLRLSNDLYMKALLILVFFVQTVFIVGNANFSWDQLTILLPYGLLMAVLPLVSGIQERQDSDEEETLDDIEEDFSYLRANFFLPILVCLALPAWSIFGYLQEEELRQERHEVAHFIQAETEQTASIIAWDNSAHLYLESQRLAATTILTAEPYLNTPENQTSFAFDMNKNEATFVVVNTAIPLLDRVKENLETYYEKVDLGTSHLQVYQKK